MEELIVNWKCNTTHLYFDAVAKECEQFLQNKQVVLITDQNVFNCHSDFFLKYSHIIIPAGESSKNFDIVQFIIEQLLEKEVDKKGFLVGVGGGVVSDITGFVAGIYKRGVSFGFMPTSLLAMVDASIGGKNGLSFGAIKNCIGLIRQPEFILFHYDFLRTLPHEEWINGFAEVIKHACIADADLFHWLENYTINDIKNDSEKIRKLIKWNVLLKLEVVKNDETELGNRKILNFGHTLGHAIENTYNLSHGQAVAIGMVAAAEISQRITGFSQIQEVENLIKRYELPLRYAFEKIRTLQNILQDKKRNDNRIQYILLNKIGEAQIYPICFSDLETFL